MTFISNCFPLFMPHQVHFDLKHTNNCLIVMGIFLTLKCNSLEVRFTPPSSQTLKWHIEAKASTPPLGVITSQCESQLVISLRDLTKPQMSLIDTCFHTLLSKQMPSQFELFSHLGSVNSDFAP